MTPAEFHELQLRRLALALDKLNVPGTSGAVRIAREAADFIQQQAATVAEGGV